MNVHRESRHILLACASGSFIGALLALKLTGSSHHPSWFSLLGILIGGGIGYILCDAQHCRQGVASAYLTTINWRPYTQFWKTWFSGICAYFNVGFHLILFPIIGVALLNGFKLVEVEIVSFLALGISILCLMFSFMVTASFNNDFEKLKKDEAVNWRVVKYVNLIGLMVLIYHLTVYVLKAIPAILYATPRAIRTIVTFVQTAFIKVHSHKRTLCMIDASFGAAVGYVTSSMIVGPLIGAVVGGLLGVSSYELLTVRWLRHRNNVAE